MNEVTTVHVDWLVIIGVTHLYMVLLPGSLMFIVCHYDLTGNPDLNQPAGWCDAGMMIIGLRDFFFFESLPQWHKHIYTRMGQNNT